MVVYFKSKQLAADCYKKNGFYNRHCIKTNIKSLYEALRLHALASRKKVFRKIVKNSAKEEKCIKAAYERSFKQ